MNISSGEAACWSTKHKEAVFKRLPWTPHAQRYFIYKVSPLLSSNLSRLLKDSLEQALNSKIWNFPKPVFVFSLLTWIRCSQESTNIIQNHIVPLKMKTQENNMEHSMVYGSFWMREGHLYFKTLLSEKYSKCTKPHDHKKRQPTDPKHDSTLSSAVFVLQKYFTIIWV